LSSIATIAAVVTYLEHLPMKLRLGITDSRTRILCDGQCLWGWKNKLERIFTARRSCKVR